MGPDYFNDLKKLLEKLPGIGPRQASRFIWAMLDFESKERENLAGLINSLDKRLSRCGECFRAFSVEEGVTCSFCRPNSLRDHSKIMILERDGDLTNIEKSGAYKGLYHVLGGVLDPLEEDRTVRGRIKALYARIKGQREIILALSPTKLGEFTASYIEKVLEPLVASKKLKVTRLGRGLSTGTDLEYADETTLRKALDNRR